MAEHTRLQRTLFTWVEESLNLQISGFAGDDVAELPFAYTADLVASNGTLGNDTTTAPSNATTVGNTTTSTIG